MTVVRGRSISHSRNAPVPASEALDARAYRPVEASGPNAAGAVFAGEFSARRLPSGITYSRTDLTALVNHEQHAVVERSLIIRLLLSPSPTEMEFNGKRSLIRPNEIFVCRAGEPLGGVSRSHRGERYKCLGLHLEPDLMADDELAERIETFLKDTGDLAISMTPSIAALAQELFNSRYTEDTVDLLCESFALNVLARCLDPVAAAAPKPRITPSQTQCLLRVRDYINTHAEDRLSMKALAVEAGMSLSTFKEKYRAYFRETPFETVRSVRLDRAFAGLSQGQLTVSEAAYRSGYAHVSSFSDAYMRRFGQRPSARPTGGFYPK